MPHARRYVRRKKQFTHRGVDHKAQRALRRHHGAQATVKCRRCLQPGTFPTGLCPDCPEGAEALDALNAARNAEHALERQLKGHE